MRRDVTCTSFDWPFDISLILGHEGSDMERKRLKRYYILTTTHNAKQHNTHSMYVQINFWHAQRWTSINLYYLYYISYWAHCYYRYIEVIYWLSLHLQQQGRKHCTLMTQATPYVCVMYVSDGECVFICVYTNVGAKMSVLLLACILWT